MQAQLVASRCRYETDIAVQLLMTLVFESCLDTEPNNEQVENHLSDLFEAADKNADGVVEPDELAQVLGSSGFHLLDANIQRVLEATVSDWDGMINYRELLPVVTQLLRHMEQVQRKPMQHNQKINWPIHAYSTMIRSDARGVRLSTNCQTRLIESWNEMATDPDGCISAEHWRWQSQVVDR